MPLFLTPLNPSAPRPVSFLTLSLASFLLRACWCMVVITQISCCQKSESPSAKPAKSGASVVVRGQNPTTILTLSRDQATRFETLTLQKTQFTENLRVSAQAVAGAISSSSQGANLGAPLIVFEVQETTQLFASYIKSKTTFERTTKQYARVQELIGGNAASGKELLEAQTDRNQAEAELREAESRLIQEGFNPKEIERMRTGTILLMCDVPESRVSEVQLHENVQFEFTSFVGEVFQGRVAAISDAIDPQTRTVKISIEVPNPKGRIKLGMFAKVSIERDAVQALSIPYEALVTADGKSFVFVKQNDSTFERRAVTIGSDNGKEYAVKSGIENGERVVVKNAILLKGMSFGY
jgi:membrane fusion protein, heavy metal efflux system